MLVTPTKYPHITTSALNASWAEAVWSIRIHKLWDQYYHHKPDDNRDNFQIVHETLEPLRKETPNMGVSINEADIWEENHQLAFWGQENYDKLVQIKAQVDPNNLLSNWMAVGWNTNEDRFRCYPKPLQYQS